MSLPAAQRIPLPRTGTGPAGDCAARLPEADAAARERFEALALPLLGVLCRTAARMTRSESDAEDLVQDALVCAFRFFHRYQPGTNFRAWVFTIMRNTYINRHRRRTREPALVGYGEVEDFILCHQSVGNCSSELGNPEKLLLQKLQYDSILSAISKLPDYYRMAVTLSDVEGRSYREVAEAMGCPIGTVRSRLNRARRILQHNLRAHL